MQQYFIKSELVLNKPVELPSSITHHLLVVLKRRSTESIRLVNQLGVGFICSVNPSATTAIPSVAIDFKPDSLIDITVVLAFIKKDRFEWAVEKLAEAGVKRVIPLNSAHSQSLLYKNDWPKKKNRLNAIALEASEQNYRQYPMIVEDYISLSQCVSVKSDLNIVAHQHGESVPLLLKKKKYQSATIVIGPEGGLQPQEIALLQQQGFDLMALGHRIFRSESAAFAAAILVGSAYE